MFNKEEMLKSINNYFDSITEDEFVNDLKETGSLDLVEEIVSDKVKEDFYTIRLELFRNLFVTTRDIRYDEIDFEVNFKSLYHSFLYKDAYMNYSIFEDKLREEDREILRIGA